MHWGAFFLLGCVVVQNVATRRPVKCARPKDDWWFSPDSKWCVLLPNLLSQFALCIVKVCHSWRTGYMFSFAAGNTRAANANASQLNLTFMSSFLKKIISSEEWWVMCTTNVRFFAYAARIPFQYLPLALKWMDGYANGRDKTLSWSEGVVNLTVYHTKLNDRTHEFQM